MKKVDFIEIIEERIAEEVQRIREDESGEYSYIMNHSQMVRFLDYLSKNFDENQVKVQKNEETDIYRFYEAENEKNEIYILEEYQRKVERKKDIKVVSDSKANYSLKMIYHLNSDDKKEYRIYLSFKDSSNISSKIKRLRLRDAEIKKVEKNLDKMKKVYNDILKMEREDILKKYAK